MFFLGDNIYWRGSAELYKARFDDVYEPLIRDCKVHVALGNHDLKGCRAVEEDERWESCLQDLRTSLEGDRKARYLRQGLEEDAAGGEGEGRHRGGERRRLAAEAIRTRRGNCLPGDATAYEERGGGTETCNAAAALAHTQFGFGSVEKGDPPSRHRQRYYSILWPLPKLNPGASPGSCGGPAPAAARRRHGAGLEHPRRRRGHARREGREDELQLLWFRNAMSQWLPAPGESHRIWKIVAVHHPPYTPRSCACRIFGKCIGGHGDEPGLRDQLARTLEDLEPPDLMFTAHNHIYARSRPLDASGHTVTTGKGGVRYFVTGGGGGPLYALKGEDARFAAALNVYHFVYLRLTPAAAFYWAIDAGRKGPGLRLLREGLERRPSPEPELQLRRRAASAVHRRGRPTHRGGSEHDSVKIAPPARPRGRAGGWPLSSGEQLSPGVLGPSRADRGLDLLLLLGTLGLAVVPEATDGVGRSDRPRELDSPGPWVDQAVGHHDDRGSRKSRATRRSARRRRRRRGRSRR